jgi:hypothetical protein
MDAAASCSRPTIAPCGSSSCSTSTPVSSGCSEVQQLDDLVRTARYRHNDEFVVAMKEDLAEWLNGIHVGLSLTADDFFEQLETGVILCRHANVVVTNSSSTDQQPKRSEDQTSETAADANQLRASTGCLAGNDGAEMTSAVSPSKQRTAGRCLCMAEYLTKIDATAYEQMRKPKFSCVSKSQNFA